MIAWVDNSILSDRGVIGHHPIRVILGDDFFKALIIKMARLLFYLLYSSLGIMVLSNESNFKPSMNSLSISPIKAE